MTRKHFEALARAIAYSRLRTPDGKLDQSPHVVQQWRVTAQNVAAACAAANPNFDRARFLAACEVSK